MKSPLLLYRLVLAIAALTLLSGLVQLLAPGLILDVIAPGSTPASRHFFAIIGMFMFLFGGMLLQALRGPADPSVVVLWSGLQKFGASIAVALGVRNAVFSSLALLVASFDLLSGIVVLWYWRRIRG